MGHVRLGALPKMHKWEHFVGLIAAGADVGRIGTRWPGGVVATTPPATTDPRVPRTNDRVVVAGKVRNVQSATPIYIDGELVRIDVEVLG